MTSRILSVLVLAVSLSAGSACSTQRSHYSMGTPLRVEEPAFRRSLDNFGSVMVGGNLAELLEDGDGVFGPMLEDIRNARVFVNLETYIFKDDEAGRMFADALIAASRRGVQVRLMVDAQGSKLGPLREALEAAGVICRDYRPLKKYSFLGRRTHRKLLVVDGKIGYTGGFCFDRRWLGKARNKDEWHDSAVRVTGPVVSQMQSIFGEGWTFTTGEILSGETFYPMLEPAGPMPAQTMKSSKGDSSSLPKMLYFMAIEASRESIHIQNPYFLPDDQIQSALVRAVKRGVDVKVMVPGKNMDIPMVRMASRGDFGVLLKGGVKIFEYQPTMIHSKTLVVDGVFTTIGSINFDARSMSKNAELSVSFYDRSFAGTMEAMFQRDLKVCKEVTYEAWKRRGTSAKIAEFFSAAFKPLY
jgi:cardiolipin synthase